jgi:hypothetical protein
MAKCDWKIWRPKDAVDLTSYVLNFNVSWGRDTFVSPYQGRVATFTIRNDDEQSDFFDINRTIEIFENNSNTTAFYGVVLTRDFNDNPGNGNMSTCVVTCVDGFTLAGNQETTTTFVAANNQLQELSELVTNDGLYTNPFVLYGTTDTNFAVGAFTGNVQSQMQQVILGDHGIFVTTYYSNYYYAPSQFDDLILSVAGGNVTFGRTSSATQIAYSNIDRSEAASESTWFNQATVTGALTTATKSNGSTAQYGVKSFTTTTTQTEKVNSSAEWWANNYISPTRLSLDLSILDLAQNATALNTFLLRYIELQYFGDVSWTVPGGASVTQTFFPDKISISATPERTRFTLGMTNINSYQSFILNSTTFGILDTSRLGVGTAV